MVDTPIKLEHLVTCEIFQRKKTLSLLKEKFLQDTDVPEYNNESKKKGKHFIF